MLLFRKSYFSLTILILIVEVLIALFVRDNFVRPYLGDVLVVILIYCFIKSFINASVIETAVFVLIFSLSIEFLQYMQIVKRLELEKNEIARIILGTSFSWGDIVAYTTGIAIVLFIEKYRSKKALVI